MLLAHTRTDVPARSPTRVHGAASVLMQRDLHRVKFRINPQPGRGQTEAE